MSQYSIEVDQYISNILQPEIDRLNVSLVSMEEVGHSNTATKDTINKLNALAVIYDFLYEYALGSEEIDKSALDSIMTQFGNHQSMLTGVDVVAELRSSNIANTSRSLYPAVRIYRGNELLSYDTLLVSNSPETFKIYGDNNTRKIDVIITPNNGGAASTFTGDNYVIATNIITAGATALTIDVKTYAQDAVLLYSEVHTYNVIACNTSTDTYWIGSTNENFTINSDIVDETSDITIDPNSGTVSGVVLDFNWIALNFSTSEEYVFTSAVQQQIIPRIGDYHILIVYPVTLKTDTFVENLSGTDVALNEHLHYDSFSIFNGSTEYKVAYIRNLSFATFNTNRVFKFNIDTV